MTQLDNITKTGAILASNTSALDIDAIAAVTSRPQDVIGLHFFSPAHVMRLLEIVRGAKTDPSVLATAVTLAPALGKVASSLVYATASAPTACSIPICGRPIA